MKSLTCRETSILSHGPRTVQAGARAKSNSVNVRSDQTHTRQISFGVCNQRLLSVYSLVLDLFTLHSLPEASRFVADAEAALLEADLLVLVHVGEDGAANRKVQSASVRLPALGVIHTSLTVDPDKPTYANTSQAEIRDA